jgi:hypothetical protein
MILGGALITQYIKKEEEEPARFQKASESVRQRQADSVEYCGVVLEEDDSVSFYGACPAKPSRVGRSRELACPEHGRRACPELACGELVEPVEGVKHYP